ncbi:jg314, partial [Pararge aegeria aegeria]
IGDVTDSTTWQTLGGGVADYLSALPLPLHHLLKYSTSAVDSKREEPTILTVATNALPPMSTLTPQAPANVVNSVVVQTATIVNPVSNNVINTNANVNSIAIVKKKKKKKALKEKKPRPKPGEIRLTTALGENTF